jgi:hypothetical protein
LHADDGRRYSCKSFSLAAATAQNHVWLLSVYAPFRIHENSRLCRIPLCQLPASPKNVSLFTTHLTYNWPGMIFDCRTLICQNRPILSAARKEPRAMRQLAALGFGAFTNGSSWEAAAAGYRNKHETICRKLLY